MELQVQHIANMVGVQRKDAVHVDQWVFVLDQYDVCI